MADTPSYNDIRTYLTDALAAEDKDKGDDLIVVDFGPDWVVYRDPDTDGPGLRRRSYKLEGETVTLTSKPEKVLRSTSYEPAKGDQSDGDERPPEDQPKNLRDAGSEAKTRLRERRKSGD